MNLAGQTIRTLGAAVILVAAVSAQPAETTAVQAEALAFTGWSPSLLIGVALALNIAGIAFCRVGLLWVSRR